jgi:hypothetical protein
MILLLTAGAAEAPATFRLSTAIFIMIGKNV